MILERGELDLELNSMEQRKNKVKEAFNFLQGDSLAGSLEEDEKKTGLGESKLHGNSLVLWEGNDLF